MPYGSETTQEQSGQGTWHVSAGMMDPGQPGNPLRFGITLAIVTSNEYGPSPEALTEADNLGQALADFLQTRYPEAGVSGGKTYDTTRELTPTPIP